MKNLKIAIIGTSGRGIGLMDCILDMPDVDIIAVCDVYQDRIQNGVNLVKNKKGNIPNGYQNYKDIIEKEEVDCVVIASSWDSHRRITLDFMEASIPVGMEVGGAHSLEECWELVRAYERTKTECMMLENCCYGREEMTILNMIKQGLFGEIVHCQGGYEHDLREEVCMGIENRHYRLNNYKLRNGEIYPTHEIGPIAKYLDINNGNRFVTLTSMSSKSCGLNQWIADNKGKDHPDAKIKFNQGDVVTTMIKCSNGETVLLTHDTSLPRVYSRAGRVQGTKGIWMEDKKAVHIEGLSPKEDWADPEKSWEPLEGYMDKYEHPLWKEYRELGIRGGHGGMDYLVLRAFFEAVKTKSPMPINIYDTATYMAVTILSENSIALGSIPVVFPDFTNGSWINIKKENPSKYALSKVFFNCFY